MTDNEWLCRNCKHFHTMYIGNELPENQCSNEYVSPSHPSYGCLCDHWYSNDNLVYLEEKFSESER